MTKPNPPSRRDNQRVFTSDIPNGERGYISRDIFHYNPAVTRLNSPVPGSANIVKEVDSRECSRQGQDFRRARRLDPDTLHFRVFRRVARLASSRVRQHQKLGVDVLWSGTFVLVQRSC